MKRSTEGGLHRNIELRSRVLRATRDFFYRNGYIEVETPVRIPVPALETHIDAPRSEGGWLRTSPELHMKRLLVQRLAPIFQLGSCFRRNECGARHNPEFTMLEWYRVNSDYMEILAETKDLLLHVFNTTLGSTTFNYGRHRVMLDCEWDLWEVGWAFSEFAGWDPIACWDEQRFEHDLMEKVEPALPCERPCILKDYPAPAAALARLKTDNPAVAERWELYIGGMEISNTYSELCDVQQQRQRFAECAAQRAALNKEVYPPDQEFLQALEQGVPPCAGSALGFDRLMMLLCNAARIDEVRLFAQHPGELY